MSPATRFAKLKDSVVVDILADANLRSVLSNSASSNTPVAGALGIGIGRMRSNLTVLINVVGLADTLSSNFGSALLPPTNYGVNSGHLSFLIDWRQLNPWANESTPSWLSRIGYHLYLSGAPAVWRDSTANGTTYTGSFNVGAAAQLSYELFNQDVQGTTVTVLVDFGPVTRLVLGDLASSSDSTLRKTLLTTTATGFWGGEAGLTVGVKEVRLGVSVYMFGGGVPGLSHGQAVFGFSIANAFFSGHSMIVQPPTPTSVKQTVASARLSVLLHSATVEALANAADSIASRLGPSSLQAQSLASAATAARIEVHQQQQAAEALANKADEQLKIGNVQAAADLANAASHAAARAEAAVAELNATVNHANGVP